MRRASEQWMESAEMDIGSVEQIIHREALTPGVAFHSQQCVEKCFKAVLEEHAKNVTVRRRMVKFRRKPKRRRKLWRTLLNEKDKPDLFCRRLRRPNTYYEDGM